MVYTYSDMGTEYGNPVIYGVKRLNKILKSQEYLYSYNINIL